MNTPRPVHFEIFAGDLAKSSKFYGDVFGWKFEKWGTPDENVNYQLITTGDKDSMGINGGMTPCGEVPAKGGPNAFVITMGVSNFDEYHDKIMKAGGTVQMEKHLIPGIGTHAYYKDPEGIMFAILEPLPEMMGM
jgi:predicted enzyme related to lactoylglutathione lyase